MRQSAVAARDPLLTSLALAISLAVVGPVDSAPTPTASAPRGVLGTYVRGADRLVAGTRAALRVATHWAASESESGPWPGVEVSIALVGDKRRAALWRGRSDAGGLAEARFEVPAWPDGKYTLAVDSRADKRQNHLTQSIEIAAGGKLLLESDKPLYQPAQIIHLRAIAMRPTDGKPVTGRNVTFEVSDPRGNRVWTETRALSEFGVAAADCPLADEITTGSYRARVSLDEETAAELALSVERYSLPKFKIALESDRSWARPGDRVKISVEARYFFGKPVAGGQLEIDAALSGGARVALEKITAKLDQDGRARVETQLPASLAVDEARLRLHARVTDAAEHRQEATREIAVGNSPLRVELISEAAHAIAGVEQRVWVLAGRPDGAPLENAEVELAVDGKAFSRARTDALGLATIAWKPAPGTRGALTATVRESGGAATASKHIRSAPNGILLRPERAIVLLGAPLAIEIFGDDGITYLDVVKDGQTLETATIDVRGGRGRIVLAADDKRFGTLALLAYRIAPDGTQRRDARLVYIERPSALRVEVRTGDRDFRPGEQGRIHLRVVDAKSGEGARASVGLVMVDQSLLALKAMTPGAARLYFTLANEATRAQEKLKLRPGGYTVEKLADEGALDAARDEAARILLAGATPPWSGFEHDPWAARRDANDALVQRLADATPRYADTHFVGERAPNGKWRWRHDLVAQMVSDGALSARDTRDPWGRAVPTKVVIDSVGMGDFDSFAAEQASSRLQAIYLAFARAGLERRLPADGKNGVTLTLADVEKLAADGKLAKHLLTDPWGAPWRIVERPKPRTIARLRSRYLLASAGPDGRVGSADDLYPLDVSYGRAFDQLGVMAVHKAEAFGFGGLGLIGRGAGGGGFGAGTIGLGSLGTIGRGGGGGAEEPRVRRDFPETMLWRPEVVTDARGEASVDVAIADSITTWRLFAEAVAADGRIGQATMDVRVFQDFFADLDLPPAVTQHDELSVPVAVHNYLPTAQRVTLELDDAPWFARLGERTQSIDLAPAQVGVRHFRIRVNGIGRQRLLVRARGSVASDAMEKSVEITPDGVERTVAFQDRLQPGAMQHAIDIPSGAIDGASAATVKIYPSMASHVIEGLDSMLRVPGGCFEQTSSTTYPNALILQYLRQTGKSTPEVEKKARAYLQMGYQRLLSFEVRGGGFSWFGDAPANQILTAYGIQEFADMAKVFTIDKRVIDRTQKWLVSRQKADGSWERDRSFINEGATDHFNDDVLRITAYIALALERTGGDRAAIERARTFVRRAAGEKRAFDSYTLSLVTELLGNDSLADRLWEQRKDEPDGKSASFSTKEKTPTYGAGKSATVETTALAAWAMMQAGRAPLARVERAIAFLLGNKDSFGNWHSTQATILSLKTLLAWGASTAKKAHGDVVVRVDGSEAGRVRIEPGLDVPASLDLPQATRAGAHRIELAFAGGGSISYQLVGRWWEPRDGSKSPPQGDLSVETRLRSARLKSGESVRAEVRAEARGEAIDMPIVTAGLPPGFDVDGEALDKLVKSKLVDKVQRTPREVVFYLSRLEPGKPVTLPVELRARFPLRVQVPAATAYEYYRPERKAAGRPLEVVVES